MEIYTEHPLQTTVAKMSPSGYYVASGDTGGNIRIWDATQPTHILKVLLFVRRKPDVGDVPDHLSANPRYLLVR